MKISTKRVGISLLLALGIVAALGFAATVARAADEPVKEAVSPSVENGRGCWYWVRRGDTLFSIGLRHGVSPYYLAHLNGLWNPNIIYAGMKLLVPCGGKQPYPPKPPRPPKPPPTPCGEPLKYLVRPGDNLFRIALNYGTTVNALRDANNLWGRVLRPGTTLIIPCPAPSLPTKEAPPPDRVAPATPPSDQPPAELPPEPSASVLISDTTLDPVNVTIQVGQSVLWTNSSQNIYTIVSGLPGQPNDQFPARELAAGGTLIHAFEAAGSYSYYISENPTLIGQIAVNP